MNCHEPSDCCCGNHKLADEPLTGCCTTSATPCAVEPPDTQLAVGPYNLLEMVNTSGSIWSKNGSAQFQAPPQAEVDLNVFYGVDTTPYVITDPRVQYDAGTGRWLSER